MPDNAEVYKLKKRVRYYDKQSFGQQLDQLLARHTDGSIEKHQRMPSLVYLLFEWLFEVESKGTSKTAAGSRAVSMNVWRCLATKGWIFFSTSESLCGDSWIHADKIFRSTPFSLTAAGHSSAIAAVPSPLGR